jgi:hypothetical protein
MLTVGEIKRAICTHEHLAPVEPPEQRREAGIWQTKLVCPACGAWTLRETPDTAGLTPMTVEHGQNGDTPAEPAWRVGTVRGRATLPGAAGADVSAVLL